MKRTLGGEKIPIEWVDAPPEPMEALGSLA